MEKTKKFSKRLKIFTLFTTLALSIGIGVALAPKGHVNTEATVNYAAEADFTLKTASNNNYNSVWNYGNWSLYGAANNGGSWAFMKFGGKNTTISDHNPVYVRGPIVGKAVSSVDVVFNGGNLTAGSVNSWGLKAYSDSGYTTEIASAVGGEMKIKVAETLTLTPAADIPAGSYYEVYFDLANATTTNGIIWVDKIQFVEAIDTSIDLTDLSFTGTPTTVIYEEGVPFNPAGLTVTATFSNLSTSDVTAQVVWQTLVPGMTSVEGTYSYTGLNSVSKNVTITGITVTAAPIIGGIVDGHTYLITAPKATDGTPFYILKSQVDGVDSFINGASASHTEELAAIDTYSSLEGFVFTKVGVNEYHIKSGDNYLGTVSDNNGLVLGPTVDSWKVTEAVGTTVGGVEYNGVFLQDTNNGRYLTAYYQTPNFRTYGGTTGQALPAACIVLHDITALEAFATEFNSSISAVCDATGATELSQLSSVWELKAAAFDLLLDKEKAVFASGTGNASGTEIQKAIAKYNYIAKKYSSGLMAGEWDFMDRSIVADPLDSQKTNNQRSNNSLLSTIIILSAAIGLTTLGGFYFLKKRRHAR